MAECDVCQDQAFRSMKDEAKFHKFKCLSPNSESSFERYSHSSIDLGCTSVYSDDESYNGAEKRPQHNNNPGFKYINSATERFINDIHSAMDTSKQEKLRIKREEDLAGYRFYNEMSGDLSKKEKNRLKRREERSNPSYRDKERARHRLRMREKRKDPKYRELERMKNKLRMRLLRNGDNKLNVS